MLKITKISLILCLLIGSQASHAGRRNHEVYTFDMLSRLAGAIISRGFLTPAGSATGHGFDTALFEAITAGDLDLTGELLRAGANINASITDDGDTPLHIAAARGNIEMVVFLIGLGASPTLTNNHYQTPLSQARRKLATEKNSLSSQQEAITEFEKVIVFLAPLLGERTLISRPAGGAGNGGGAAHTPTRNAAELPLAHTTSRMPPGPAEPTDPMVTPPIRERSAFAATPPRSRPGLSTPIARRAGSGEPTIAPEDSPQTSAGGSPLFSTLLDLPDSNDTIDDEIGGEFTLDPERNPRPTVAVDRRNSSALESASASSDFPSISRTSSATSYSTQSPRAPSTGRLRRSMIALEPSTPFEEVKSAISIISKSARALGIRQFIRENTILVGGGNRRALRAIQAAAAAAIGAIRAAEAWDTSPEEFMEIHGEAIIAPFNNMITLIEPYVAAAEKRDAEEASGARGGGGGGGGGGGDGDADARTSRSESRSDSRSDSRAESRAGGSRSESRGAARLRAEIARSRAESTSSTPSGRTSSGMFERKATRSELQAELDNLDASDELFGEDFQWQDRAIPDALVRKIKGEMPHINRKGNKAIVPDIDGHGGSDIKLFVLEKGQWVRKGSYTIEQDKDGRNHLKFNHK